MTQEEPFHLPAFFREFFAGLRREPVVVTGVDITPTLDQKRGLSLARKLYGFYGPRDFFCLGMRYLAVKARALLPSRAPPGTIARVAAAHGVPSRLVADVNDAACIERLRSLEPDLLISVGASQVFGRDLLAVPRLDAINVHTGRLPEYRGMMSVFWQMCNGEDALGVTVHTMTETIDAGEVLLTRSMPLEGERCLHRVNRKATLLGARALIEVLRQYCDGSVTRTPVDASTGTYRSFPGREDVIRFRRRGNRLL